MTITAQSCKWTDLVSRSYMKYKQGFVKRWRHNACSSFSQHRNPITFSRLDSQPRITTKDNTNPPPLPSSDNTDIRGIPRTKHFLWLTIQLGTSPPLLSPKSYWQTVLVTLPIPRMTKHIHIWLQTKKNKSFIISPSTLYSRSYTYIGDFIDLIWVSNIYITPIKGLQNHQDFSGQDIRERDSQRIGGGSHIMYLLMNSSTLCIAVRT